MNHINSTVIFTSEKIKEQTSLRALLTKISIYMQLRSRLVLLVAKAFNFRNFLLLKQIKRFKEVSKILSNKDSFFFFF